MAVVITTTVTDLLLVSFVTIAGALVAGVDSLDVHFIRDFDRNGLSHVGHMLGLAILFRGLRIALQSRGEVPLRSR